MCIKVAILTSFLRIFVPKGVRNAFYWILHVLIWSNIFFYTITTITEVFRCLPREKIWNPWFEGGTCRVDVLAQNIACSVLNFISDTIILGIPQWIIWHLNLRKTQKWGMSLLFVIGIGYVNSIPLSDHRTDLAFPKRLGHGHNSDSIFRQLASFRRRHLPNDGRWNMDDVGGCNWISHHGYTCTRQGRQSHAGV